MSIQRRDQFSFSHKLLSRENIRQVEEDSTEALRSTVVASCISYRHLIYVQDEVVIHDPAGGGDGFAKNPLY